jgi:hypothetical protein
MKRKKMFVLFLFFLVAIGPSIAAADVPVSSIPERIYRATFFLSDHLLFKVYCRFLLFFQSYCILGSQG